MISTLKNVNDIPFFQNNLRTQTELWTVGSAAEGLGGRVPRLRRGSVQELRFAIDRPAAPLHRADAHRKRAVRQWHRGRHRDQHLLRPHDLVGLLKKKSRIFRKWKINISKALIEIMHSWNNLKSIKMQLLKFKINLYFLKWKNEDWFLFSWLFSKLACYGATRNEALKTSVDALDHYVIRGTREQQLPLPFLHI